ncbi:MAG: DUF58 domain-containing protein, partial [Cellulomonadaceae bacterium]|nr:DUF58 domain-containing protein [Cellulomonadaceae bacterium]
MAITWRALVLAGLGLLAVAMWPAPGTVLVWAACVLVACLVDVVLAASPRAVTVTRRAPTSVRLGDAARCDLDVVNTSGRRLRAVIRDAWPPSVVPDAGVASVSADTADHDGPAIHSTPASSAVTARSARHRVALPAGEGTRLRTPLLPTRRGDRQAGPVTIRSFGPLGLAARQATIPVPVRLRVLPEFASRRHLPSRLARLRELDGRAAVQVRGQGTEFDSLREYVVGDDVRSIDWRATARRADVVVRTWRPERDRRVLIVIDTGRTSAVRVGVTSAETGRSGNGSVSGRGAVGHQPAHTRAPTGAASDAGYPRVEASIEAALLLAALADRAGDRVQVLAFDRTLRARVAGASGPRLLPEVADALATVTPRLIETDWPALVAQVQAREAQRALVVVLTSLDPAAARGGLTDTIGQLTSRHPAVIAAVAGADA